MSTQTNEGQELERREAGSELENKRLDAGLAEGNGVINPARWQMLAAIAETVSSTEFVPAGLRGSDKKVLACLLYGDALGLQPMTSLKEIHVIDGVPGLSAAAMAALVRKAHPGHRLRREELRDDQGRFLGVKAFAERGDTGETDEYTFTLEMAVRANLMGKHNWKSYPEAMCTARAYSQLCTFLFPDVFMGSPYTSEEIESFEPEPELVEGNKETGSPIVPTPPAPASEEHAPAPPAAAQEPTTEQTEWEVALEGTGESVAYIDADDRNSIKASGAPMVKFPDVEGKFEIVGYEVDGATGKEKLIVRPESAPAGQPAAGSPEAVVKENIPEILGKYVAQAQERGDVEFVRGVLEAEKAGKARGRLVSALEEIIGTLEADALKKTLEGDGTGDDNPLLEEGEIEEPDEQPAAVEEPIEEGEVSFLPEEPVETPEPGAGGLENEVDPEIPYSSATRRAKLVRLAAFCGYMEDQQPTKRAWHLSGIIGSAARQFGGTIHALEDLTDEQLELIWKAAEQHAAEGVQFLALMQPVDVVTLAEKAGQ